MHTFRSGPYVADLGAMVITGLGGNPLAILKRQMELKMSKIKRRCPLYFTTGMSTVLVEKPLRPLDILLVYRRDGPA